MAGSRWMPALRGGVPYLLITLLLGVTEPMGVAAAPDAEPAGGALSFKAYLAEVAASNLDYAAARYNVSIAAAQLVAARVFPNPTLNGGTSGRDVTHHGELR